MTALNMDHDTTTKTSNEGSSSFMPYWRRRRGTMAAAFLLVTTSLASGVAAFTSSPSRPMTMRMDSHLLNRNSGVGSSSSTSRTGLRAVQPPQTQKMLKKVVNQRGIPSGSPLEMICTDQNEFELRVGHAMDVLRQDYPYILTNNPDYSIYDPHMELIDPSGVQLHGVKNYKAAFRLLHAIVGIFYCPERSGLTFRMCFDKARQNIRIHWNAYVIPKAMFGGQKSTLHVDGISVYEISMSTGNITQHRIERLVINDNPVMPENGIFAAMRGHAVESNVPGIPVFNVGHINGDMDDLSMCQNQDLPSQLVPFQNFNPLSRTVLFSTGEEDVVMTSSQLSAMESSPNADGNIDWDALERKNMVRKKFGLAPLTPEEFKDLQDQVAELDNQQQKRAQAAAAELAAKKKKEEQGSFFKKLFGQVLEDTCESNFDCERPEVCCDFGFKKMCCSSGMKVSDRFPRSRQGQLAEIPVIANPGPFPPQGYPRGGGYPY